METKLLKFYHQNAPDNVILHLEPQLQKLSAEGWEIKATFEVRLNLFVLLQREAPAPKKLK